MFVVLRHEAGSTLQRTSQTHLDWMFEIEGRLKTFATDIIDPRSSHEGIAAIALPDHRLQYLDFEGDISGGRGKVTRIAFGSYELIRTTDSLWHARLDWNSNDAACEDRIASEDDRYRMRSELWLEDVRGVLQLRLSATR
jgi:hypothetical protein